MIMYVCIYIHTCIHILCIYTLYTLYIYTDTHIYIYTYIYIHIHTHMDKPLFVDLFPLENHRLSTSICFYADAQLRGPVRWWPAMRKVAKYNPMCLGSWTWENLGINEWIIIF